MGCGGHVTCGVPVGFDGHVMACASSFKHPKITHKTTQIIMMYAFSFVLRVKYDNLFHVKYSRKLLAH